MNFLFLAFEYPPMNTGGAQRPARLARALVNERHNVTVVTASITQVEEPSDGVKVHRIAAKPISRASRLRESAWISLTDRSGDRWKSALFKALPGIIAQHSPDVLWVTVPPFGIARLGLEVAERFSLPFLFDMRDAWSQWGIAPYPTRWHYEAVRKLEQRILQSADAIAVTTNEMRSDLLRAQPLIHPKKISVLKNGYSGEVTATRTATLRVPTDDAPLRIGYVGSFYYTPQRHRLMLAKWYTKKPHQWLQYTPRIEDWRYRSPYYVFTALVAFQKTHPELAGRIKLEFVGHIPDWLRLMVTQASLEQHVLLHGPKTHDTAMEFVANCDLMLATSVKVNGGVDYCIAGKTYEYVQLMKPVLGFVTKGAQRNFLEATGLLIEVNPDDTAAAVQTLHQLATGQVSLTPVAQFIEGASILNTAKELIFIAREIA
ncbi:MAG: glycosyltransferase [Flavobacteriales bacterium]